MLTKTHRILFLMGIFFSILTNAQDSIKKLPSINIIHVQLPYSIALLENASPSYILNEDFLNLIGARDIGDAMKFIPGAQVKDYGGAGGVKTISYRSLGATHTGVSLDNNSIVNTQIGAINLSSFESFGMKSLTFSSGQPPSFFALPTAYIPANSIQINSSLMSSDTAFNFHLYQNIASINAYESGLYFGVPINDKWKIAAQVFSKYGNGRYDYKYNLTGTEANFRRSNSSLFNYKGRVGIVYKLVNGKISITAYHNKLEQELPGAVILFNPLNDQKLVNEDSRADVDFMKVINGNWVLRTNLNIVSNYTRYEDPTFLNNQGFLRSSYRQSRQSAGIIVSRILGAPSQKLFLGFDGANSDLTSSEFTNNPNRFNLNSVLGGKFILKSWIFEGNLSHQFILDKARSSDSTITQNYSKLSPYLAVSVIPFKKTGLRFRTYYKRTFRMPTFNDLYYNFIGNTNLKPENAHLVNLGVNWSIDLKGGKNIGEASTNNLEISVDGFGSLIQNKIVAIPTKDLFNWSMQNIGKTSVLGTDLTVFYSQKMNNLNWSVTTNFTYNSSTDQTDVTSSSFGQQIPYTPLISGNLTFVLGWKGYQLESGINYTGKRYSLNENILINQLDPFLDLDIGFSKKFKLSANSVLGVNLKVMNVLNKNYEVIRSFPMPGRYYQLTINYSYK
jgi:vitamin B12 transporter